MKVNGKKLRRLIQEELNLLLEQEDPFEEEEAAPADETETETPEEEEGAEGEEEAEEEVEEVEPPGEESQTLGKTVDDELNALFVDFEENAITSAKLQQANENVRYSLKVMLLEQEDTPDIDMEVFAADVARLVKNYDSLLDWKAIIIKKANDYLLDKYDQTKVDALTDILNFRYDLTLEVPEDIISPVAVGASVQAAEGGA